MIRTAVLALLLVSAPSLAEAPSSAPSSETLVAARDMLGAANVKDRMHALMPRIGEAAVREMQKEFDHSEVPDTLQTQLSAAMRAYLGSLDSAFTPSLIDQMAGIYARHFSVDELRHLTTIMRDPVMLKYQQAQPDIVSEILPIMMTAMKPEQDAFKAKMKQIVGDWIRAHPADKAKLPKSMTS